MRDAGNIKAKLFIEGIEVPMSSVSRTRNEGNMASATVGLFYDSTLRQLSVHSSITIFIYSDRAKDNWRRNNNPESTASSDGWELFFDGRYKQLSISETSKGRSASISAVGRFSALSEMPLMIYNFALSDEDIGTYSARLFYGMDPKAIFVRGPGDYLMAQLADGKTDTGEAIANTIKYFVDQSGDLSPLYARMNALAGLGKTLTVASNGTIISRLGQDIMKKIVSGIEALKASSTIWDVMGYLLRFGQLNFTESIDAVDKDGNRIDAMVKPVMHFMRPPLCNTILMREESLASLSFSSSGAESITRYSVTNSAYNSYTMPNSHSAYAPIKVKGLIKTLRKYYEELGSNRGDWTILIKWNKNALDKIYSPDELLRESVVAVPSRSSLEGYKTKDQGPWLDAIASYSYDVNKYATNNMSIDGLSLNRNLIPGFTTTIITRNGEMVMGVVYTVTDTIDFVQGSARTSAIIANPIYQDEFKNIEGFSMVEAESNLAYYDDKYKPEEISEKVFANMGMRDYANDEKRRPYFEKHTTINGFFSAVKAKYISLSSYEYYSRVFTRQIVSMADMVSGWGAKKSIGYKATVNAKDTVPSSYTGAPFLIERQELAKIYAAKVKGKKIGDFEIASSEEPRIS